MKKYFVLALMALASINASAADSSSEKKDEPRATSGPSKESREKMAAAHDKMAKCLRSEKSMRECHEEMHKQCKEGGGKDCPMMGKMGKGKGHHHHEDSDEHHKE